MDFMKEFEEPENKTPMKHQHSDLNTNVSSKKIPEEDYEKVEISLFDDLMVEKKPKSVQTFNRRQCLFEFDEKDLEDYSDQGVAQ